MKYLFLALLLTCNIAQAQNCEQVANYLHKHIDGTYKLDMWTKDKGHSVCVAMAPGKVFVVEIVYDTPTMSVTDCHSIMEFVNKWDKDWIAYRLER